MFYPWGLHAVAVAGIKVNHRDALSSKLIIYDPVPVGLGHKTEERWGKFLADAMSVRTLTEQDPNIAAVWKKQGWFGTGTYFLHR